MRRVSRRATAVMGGIFAGVMLCGLAGAATAAGLGAAQPDLLTSDQVKQQWETRAGDEDAAVLPDGSALPEDPPAFFDGKSELGVAERGSSEEFGYQEYYEAGLVDEVEWAYVRCAWLDEAVQTERAGDTKRHDAALKELAAQAEERIREVPDYASYLDSLASISASKGVSAESVEFEWDCEGATW